MIHTLILPLISKSTNYIFSASNHIWISFMSLRAYSVAKRELLYFIAIAMFVYHDTLLEAEKL